MKYKFSKSLNVNYSALEKYLHRREEVSKNELLNRCTGQINFDLLQNLKHIAFDRIGKNDKGELYVV